MIHKFFQEHHDVQTVILAHLAAIGLSFTNIELGLKIISLLTAIGYTIWKWQHEWKKAKKK